jgi:hypothetical protein
VPNKKKRCWACWVNAQQITVLTKELGVISPRKSVRAAAKNPKRARIAGTTTTTTPWLAQPVGEPAERSATLDAHVCLDTTPERTRTRGLIVAYFKAKRRGGEGSWDWCHFCGTRQRENVEVWFPDNAEHELVDVPIRGAQHFHRICADCGAAIAAVGRGERDDCVRNNPELGRRRRPQGDRASTKKPTAPAQSVVWNEAQWRDYSANLWEAEVALWTLDAGSLVSRGYHAPWIDLMCRVWNSVGVLRIQLESVVAKHLGLSWPDHGALLAAICEARWLPAAGKVGRDRRDGRRPPCDVGGARRQYCLPLDHCRVLAEPSRQWGRTTQECLERLTVVRPAASLTRHQAALRRFRQIVATFGRKLNGMIAAQHPGEHIPPDCLFWESATLVGTTTAAE